MFPETPAETCMGVNRAKYSYYLGLVAGTIVLLSTFRRMVSCTLRKGVRHGPGDDQVSAGRETERELYPHTYSGLDYALLTESRTYIRTHGSSVF